MPPDPGLPTTGANVPVMDDFGLPVKPPSMALAYLLMTVVIVGDAACAAVFAYGQVHRIPGQVLGIAAGVGAIVLAGGPAVYHKLKLDQALGPTSRRVMNVAFAVAWLGVVLLLQSIDPNATGA